MKTSETATKSENQTSPPVSEPPLSDDRFNPLQESVNEKNYSASGAMPSGGAPVDIPEHIYQTPPDVGADIPTKEGQAKEKEKKGKQSANPEMAEASAQEKSEGAAVLADVVLNTWAQTYKGANNLFKISEKKIAKLQAEGKVDPHVSVPYGAGVAPLSTVIRDFNAEAEHLLVIEDEFREQVHPLLSKEFEKAGHGMTPRQQLIYLVSMKLVSDGVKAFQFIKTKNDYLRFAREQTELARQGVVHGKASTPPAEAPAPETTSADKKMAEAQVQEEAVTDVAQDRMTIQDQIMAKHLPGGVTGSSGILNTVKARKVMKDAKQKSKKKDTVKKSATSSAAEHIAQAKERVEHDPPPTASGKRGRGRPKGAKNKPK